MESRRDRARATGRHGLPAGVALFVLALLAFVPAAAAASGDLAWQRVYNGTGTDLDLFNTAVPAPNGGVYVVGQTLAANYDFLSARYDAAGHRRWLRIYDGSAGGNDYAYNAAADASGNLIVVGSANSATMAVVKYGSGGRLRWARIYDDPATGSEAATNVAVDTAGNIYVVGWRDGPASGLDIVLVKYSPGGARRWARTYLGPVPTGDDQATGIATDRAGSIYVTGFSPGVGSGLDVVTLKYDAAGHRRWVKRWDGPAGGADWGNAIAVSGAGAIYVAGATAGISSDGDAVVLKYASSGALRWSRSRTSPGAFSDAYLGLTLMGNGDLVAVGSYYGGAGNAADVLLTRFSPAGTTRWLRTYNGPDGLDDEGHYVATAPSGAVYVTGKSDGAATGSDFLTLKYGAAGHFRWARRYSSAGDMNDFPDALVVRSGAVYVAGYQAAASGEAATLLKYRP